MALQSDQYRTLFAARIDPNVSWAALLGEDVLRRAALDRETFATSLAAGRWDDAVAYALLAPIDSSGPGRGILCALRHGQPFDAVEIAAAHAAANLLAMAFADAQAAAGSERRASVHGGGPLRVLVVEDHPATRIGLETILTRAGLEVAGAVATSAEAARRLAEPGCDAVLLDLRVADSRGHATIARLRAAASTVPLVVFTADRDPELLRAALRAGANGFVPKDASPERIVAALRAAAAGLTALSAESTRALAGAAPAAEATTPRAVQRPEEPADAMANGRGESSHTAPPGGPRASTPREPIPADLLSARELELLRYVAEGYTNKEIARAMTLAEDTVKKGVQSLIAKLGATDRTHAVVLALRSGVID